MNRNEERGRRPRGGVPPAATRGTKAQNLRPQSVAIQVVNGLNYKYLCTSEDGRTRYAVIIHRPLPHSGEPSSLVSVDELPAE